MGFLCRGSVYFLLRLSHILLFKRDKVAKEKKMSNELLREGLGKFHEAFDERLKKMPPEEQQQFIEGAFLVLDSLTRFGGIDLLRPENGLSLPEFYEYLGTLKANVYSGAYHKKLDGDTYMKPLVESDAKFVAKSTMNAALVHKLLGHELNIEEIMRIQQMAILIGMHPGDLPACFQLV